MQTTQASKSQKVEFKSLYDYLGRPAGSKLGLAVAFYAAKLNETYEIRQVDTIGYKGPIKKYRPAFLDFFFNSTTNRDIVQADIKAYKAKKANKK